MSEPVKTCFVIGPIGEPLTIEHDHGLRMLNEVIVPAITPLGYVVVRADQVATPGILSVQIAALLHQADLVIADLTGKNPNVCYELGIRHAFATPCIQLVRRGETLPFDISLMRTIFIDDRTAAGVTAGITAIQAEARSVTAPLITPISLLVSVTTSVRDSALLAAASAIGQVPSSGSTPSSSTPPSSKPAPVRLDVREEGMFWASLDALDSLGAQEQVAEIVSAMVARVAARPTIVAPDANGIRAIRSGPCVTNGAVLPGIRLSYVIEEDVDGVPCSVVLLYAAEDSDTLAGDGGAAEA